MAHSKKVRIFAALVLFTLAVFCGLCINPIASANAETKNLNILWIQDYRKDGSDNVFFTVKTDSENVLDFENYQSGTFKMLKINSVTLFEMIDKGYASAFIVGTDLQVSVNAFDANCPLPDYSVKEDDTDRIVIEKGFYFPTGETNPYNLEFKYDAVFKKFVMVGNSSYLPQSEYNGTVLYDVNSDDGESKYRCLWIHFTYPVTNQYLHHLQYDAESLVKHMREIGSTAPTDLFCSQLSLLGIRDSFLDNIVVDGKSIREWMIFDKDKVRDPENLVLISLQAFYDRGTLLTVEFSPASSCDPSEAGAHTLELKEGLTFPSLVRLTGTHKYSYNRKTDGTIEKLWGTAEAEKPLEKYSETNAEGNGCGSAVTSDFTLSAVGILCGFAISVFVVKLRFKRKNGKF